LTVCSTPFFTRSIQPIFSLLFQHHISKLVSIVIYFDFQFEKHYNIPPPPSPPLDVPQLRNRLLIFRCQHKRYFTYGYIFQFWTDFICSTLNKNLPLASWNTVSET
jgi:hypothetical protein